MPIPINHRVSTAEDVKARNCVFHIPVGNVPYSFGRDLPIQAVIASDQLGNNFPPVGTQIEILQAEQSRIGVTVGFVFNNKEFVCMLDDIRVIETSE